MERFASTVRRSVPLLAAILALLGCTSEEPVETARIELADRLDVSSGMPVLRTRADDRLVAARALVTRDGTTTTYEGDLGAPGTITFPGVPAGDFTVELEYAPEPEVAGASPVVRSFPMTSRVARVGDDYWARADVELAESESTTLTITATGLPAWGELDELQLLSRRADLLGLVHGIDWGTGAPDVGDTELTEWTLTAHDLDFPHNGVLPLLRADDDLLLAHRELVQLGVGDARDPWQRATLARVTATASVSGVTIADGETTAIDASFHVLPTTTHDVDFRGSEFLALATAEGLPATARAYAEVALVNEAGEGPGYIVAAAPQVWSFAASSRAYLDPACDSGGTGVCDPSACLEGCDQRVQVHPGDVQVSVDATQPYVDGRDVLSVSYVVTIPLTDPESGEAENASIGMTSYGPPRLDVPIAPALSMPRNVRVAGIEAPLGEVTELDERAPIVSWDAPEIGTATSYTVYLLDLADLPVGEDGTSRRRTVATMITFGTSVQIPDGLIRAGRHYYVRVNANGGTWDDEVIGRAAGDELVTAWTMAGPLLAR